MKLARFADAFYELQRNDNHDRYIPIQLYTIFINIFIPVCDLSFMVSLYVIFLVTI